MGVWREKVFLQTKITSERLGANENVYNWGSCIVGGSESDVGKKTPNLSSQS